MTRYSIQVVCALNATLGAFNETLGFQFLPLFLAQTRPGRAAPLIAGRDILAADPLLALLTADPELIRKNLNLSPAPGTPHDIRLQVSAVLTGTL